MESLSINGGNKTVPNLYWSLLDPQLGCNEITRQMPKKNSSN